jgi:hypothetical protein
LTSRGICRTYRTSSLGPFWGKNDTSKDDRKDDVCRPVPHPSGTILALVVLGKDDRHDIMAETENQEIDQILVLEEEEFNNSNFLEKLLHDDQRLLDHLIS